jgi:hypothetical protein
MYQHVEGHHMVEHTVRTDMGRDCQTEFIHCIQ